MSMRSAQPVLHHERRPTRQRVLVILLAATMTALAASLYTQLRGSSGASALPYVVDADVSEPHLPEDTLQQRPRGSQLDAAIRKRRRPESSDEQEPEADADTEAETAQDAETEAANDAAAEAEEEEIRRQRVQAWCEKWHPDGRALPAQPAPGNATDKYGDQYLALCLAIKDLHRDVREWLAHHKAVRRI